MKITTKTINYAVDTIEQLLLTDGVDNDTIIVTDENRGGVFIFRDENSQINNGGTIFNGWTRQYDGAVSVKWFGAVGDGVTDDTIPIQAAFDSGHKVLILNGTYMCANLQMKDNLHVVGESHNAILKLLPNALISSYNGSIADSAGYYPGNVIGSTLNHTGGTWYDGGVRAKDENNVEYIYQDIVIENLTIDGNKTFNTQGDNSQNRSAMGACVSIHGCKNVTVRKCRITNSRIDGIHIGYTLHGGSDYCIIENNYFEGNQRLNVALITGKHNIVSNNYGENSTGGPGVNSGGAVDIEANFEDEVNYRHLIVGNNFKGGFAIVSQNKAKLNGTVALGNVWYGRLGLSLASTYGCVISNDTYIDESGLVDWLYLSGPNVAETDKEPTVVRNCTAVGFGRVVKTITQGGLSNLKVDGCNIDAGSFGNLVRGYKVAFRNTVFQFRGNTDAATIAMSNTLGGTVPNQGDIEFRGNSFYGVSNAVFFEVSRDASWAVNYDDFRFIDNKVLVTGHTNMFKNITSVSVDNNEILDFKPISISSLSKCRISKNTLKALTQVDLFTNQSGEFTDNEINKNTLVNTSINIARPKYSDIAYNNISDGKISILYSYTSGGIGGNHVAFNKLISKTAIANPFKVTTSAEFDIANFVEKDSYKYNAYLGFVSGPSIAAAISEKYIGTFE